MHRPFVQGYVELLVVALAFRASPETVCQLATKIGAIRFLDNGKCTCEEVPKEQIQKICEIISEFRHIAYESLEEHHQKYGANYTASLEILSKSCDDGYKHILSMPEGLGGLWLDEKKAYDEMVKTGYVLKRRVFMGGSLRIFNFLDNAPANTLEAPMGITEDEDSRLAPVTAPTMQKGVYVPSSLWNGKTYTGIRNAMRPKEGFEGFSDAVIAHVLFKFAEHTNKTAIGRLLGEPEREDSTYKKMANNLLNKAASMGITTD